MNCSSQVPGYKLLEILPKESDVFRMSAKFLDSIDNCRLNDRCKLDGKE